MYKIRARSKLRYLGTLPECPFKGLVPLETGNLVTGLIAAILERCMLDGIRAHCFLVPRDTVLEAESGLVLNEMLSLPVFHSILGAEKVESLQKSSRGWLPKAVNLDEAISRKHEPVGFFM